MLENLQNSFNGMFGKIAPGMCRLTMNGNIAVKCSNGCDGNLLNEADKKLISSGIQEDRTNHFNEHQGEFRYGKLDISSLKERIVADSRGVKTTLEITHCDEMDRVDEFRSNFNSIHTFDNPNV